MRKVINFFLRFLNIFCGIVLSGLIMCYSPLDDNEIFFAVGLILLFMIGVVCFTINENLQNKKI